MITRIICDETLHCATNLRGGHEPGVLYMNSDRFEGADYESELRFCGWKLLKKLLAFLGIPDFWRGWGSLKNCKKIIF